MGWPTDLTDDNFSEQTATGKWVVEFWAVWCGPCRTITASIHDLARDRNDVMFGRVDIDSAPNPAVEHGVRGIPLLVFFRDSLEQGRLAGELSKSQIEAAIRQYLG